VGTAVSIPLGSCCGFEPQDILVSQCDLLSVQINAAGGNSLTDGAAATIILESV
jgi:hypothetical protein